MGPGDFQLELDGKMVKGAKTLPFLVANQAVGPNLRGEFFFLAPGTLGQLKAKVEGPRVGGLAYRWSIQGESAPVLSNLAEVQLQRPNPGPFTLALAVTVEVTGQTEPILLERNLKFFGSGPAEVKLLNPTEDTVVEPGAPVTLRAGGSDGLGRAPVVVWVVKNQNRRRVLGFGETLKTNLFETGYNQITALGLDWEGNELQSTAIGILVPDRKQPPQILAPLPQRVFEPGKPVVLFANGSGLSYRIDGEPAQTGGGAVRMDLSPGEHLFAVEGTYGKVEAKFFIVSKDQWAAEVVALQGKVLRQVRPGQWDPVAPFDRLPPGSVLKAESDGSAELQFKEGQVYRLRPKGSVRLLPQGGWQDNLDPKDLETLRILETAQLQETLDRLRPFVEQLPGLLERYRVQEVEALDGGQVDVILKKLATGELNIEEVILQ
ncbi:MAG: hypothetical protein A2600_12625 [Candidatus Lambdaproteobacteria bacterium RIFOXYD1_FULL_56_27]|uniref:Uncharacterized protein n=1 Tax=Candidatus Lambdaproteobacteria bacterium RIFOXYD2_FULL_56_26 TaxID=1817773 RepID=A0A1F6GUA4_9PROT|nr:MAG: hypothetical protein A2426_12750 [Candidatus Lambdaproteobacteria bacterium RIFOXYC1_FULL_56_13]OGH01619.1 MAG: hypothetical protein A2557_00680 [Candidatus Lambdaproteobacteria bacterium RIFOXYD2_FULL_56_26]OGH07150.1 MAG: hypothetical protein A2600_12625 [Candidatus Lambdaproteobacteria bacterium RIFOXYD1_FULL_56_27]